MEVGTLTTGTVIAASSAASAYLGWYTGTANERQKKLHQRLYDIARGKVRYNSDPYKDAQEIIRDWDTEGLRVLREVRANVHLNRANKPEHYRNFMIFWNELEQKGWINQTKKEMGVQTDDIVESPVSQERGRFGFGRNAETGMMPMRPSGSPVRGAMFRGGPSTSQLPLPPRRTPPNSRTPSTDAPLRLVTDVLSGPIKGKERSSDFPMTPLATRPAVPFPSSSSIPGPPRFNPSMTPRPFTPTTSSPSFGGPMYMNDIPAQAWNPDGQRKKSSYLGLKKGWRQDLYGQN